MQDTAVAVAVVAEAVAEGATIGLASRGGRVIGAAAPAAHTTLLAATAATSVGPASHHQPAAAVTAVDRPDPMAGEMATGREVAMAACGPQAEVASPLRRAPRRISSLETGCAQDAAPTTLPAVGTAFAAKLLRPD